MLRRLYDRLHWFDDDSSQHYRMDIVWTHVSEMSGETFSVQPHSCL